MKIESNPEALVHWIDDHLVVIDKPPGLRSIPDGYDPSLPHVRSVLEPQLGRLWIVHRLDRLTSGLVVLARDAKTHQGLNLQFDARQVRKTYHAIVIGIPPWSEQTVTLPLKKDGDRRHRTVVDHRQGKSAHTEIRVLHQSTYNTLLEVRPITGRTHQIRAHLDAIGYPVKNDPLYGNHSQTPEPGRLALHACSLAFTHPATGQHLEFNIEDPTEFISLLTSQ